MRGGKRPGAGRPLGSKCQKKRVIESEAAKIIEARRAMGGLTPEQIDALKPCDVMRMVMIHGVENDDMKLAFMAATQLAPYVHAKLATTTVKGDADAPLMVEQTIRDERERRESAEAQALEMLELVSKTISAGGDAAVVH